MPSVCLYFQIHQPYRLRRYSVFDTDRHYFDDLKNAQIIRKVAQRCYLPAGRMLMELVRRFEGRFRLGLCITGSALEQIQTWVPEALEVLQQLAASGCVEMLSETYHHSLAFLYSRDEFRQQVELHRRAMKRVFHQEPRVFRNTELIYNNELAAAVAHMGYDAVLAEGADKVLGERSSNFVYRPPGSGSVKLLLRNYHLSDDIAFRFSNRDWPQWPLTAEKFARWVHQIEGNGQICNLFMPLETLGEHQWSDTGIFDFMAHLPAELLKHSGNDFVTPSQAAERYAPASEVDCPQAISWADTERDLSAWVGNAMQSNALNELYKLQKPVKESDDEQLLADWRRLTTSDHCYYMCTKYWADGDVHKYFSPYESPYDAYINYMNILDNVRSRVRDGKNL